MDICSLFLSQARLRTANTDNIPLFTGLLYAIENDFFQYETGFLEIPGE